MEIRQYIEEMREIQSDLLDYIDDNDKQEGDYQNFLSLINKNKICEDKHKLTSLLNLISQISNNHYRNQGFFSKIFKILSFFHPQISNLCSNYEIYYIFKDNLRVLLFLIEAKFILMTESIANQMHESNFDDYFYPEMKPFFTNMQSKQLPENFEEKRRIGENDNYICQLIRDDVIDEFIVYINQTNINLQSKIKTSIFETNFYLLSKEPTLIEYAAFFGSINILKYLHVNDVALTPSLWIYSIHGRNAELINYLVEHHISPEKKSYHECLNASIIDFHNEIADHISTNYINDNKYTNNLGINCYNFDFIQAEQISDFFILLCQLNYQYLVKVLLNKGDVDINFRQFDEKRSIFSDAINHEKGSESFGERKTPLIIAIENHNIGLLKILLEKEELDINFGYFKVYEK